MIEERTIKIFIDEEKCDGCYTHACMEACNTYGSGILKIIGGRPEVSPDREYLKRKGTECLACEYECLFRGNHAVKIEAPIPGLDMLRLK